MSKREKILASLVGATLLILALQYGFTKFRGAVDARETRLVTLAGQISDRRMMQIEGAMSEARLGQYIMRSLPSDLEKAQADYTQFLSGLVSEVGLSGASAEFTSPTPYQDLYVQLNYKISGKGNLKQLVELLYRFHRKNYLHRIHNLTVRKSRETLVIDMDIQALALLAALPDAKPPAEPALRVADDIERYMDPILYRNPMSPPNRSPQYAAEQSPQAIAGRPFNYVAQFNDPDEGQKLRYALVGDPPPALEIDPETGSLSLKPEVTGSLEVLVRATDDGWPARSAEQKIVINVVDPPAEPEPEAEAPKFDEAKQTFLTGLTQSRGRWTAMLFVRTRGETLKLAEGESFEVGPFKGTVVDVTSTYAVLEHEGERFVLRFDTSLADAAESTAP